MRKPADEKLKILQKTVNQLPQVISLELDGKWCLVGGIAFILHGLDWRLTDIDIAAKDHETLQSLLSALESAGYRKSRPYITRITDERVRVYVLRSRGSLEANVLLGLVPAACWNRLSKTLFRTAKLKTADPYDLIILKALYHDLTGRQHKRQQDLGDVRSLWEERGMSVEEMTSRLKTVDKPIMAKAQNFLRMCGINPT